MHSLNLTLKTCNKCKVEKPLTEYSKDSRNKDKLKRKCRSCLSADKKDYRRRNPEMDKIYRQTWLAKNKEHTKAYDKNYRKIKAAEVNARNAKRKADKIQRTPKWLTKDDLIEIKNIYKLAYKKSVLTNQKWHVDHIVPLLGKTVSGLHVPWNLRVITAIENIKKNNKYVD